MKYVLRHGSLYKVHFLEFRQFLQKVASGIGKDSDIVLYGTEMADDVIDVSDISPEGAENILSGMESDAEHYAYLVPPEIWAMRVVMNELFIRPCTRKELSRTTGFSGPFFTAILHNAEFFAYGLSGYELTEAGRRKLQEMRK